MKLFTSKKEVASDKRIVLDDMILTKDMPTAAGSKMLDGYMSLFEATVAEKLTDKDYAICGKANVGEMAIDLLGETSYFGACESEGVLSLPAAQIVKSGEAHAALTLDVNGSPRRGAALSGLVYVKPTYGTVSRFGTIPAACSGETVGVMATDASDCAEVLSVISGYDSKDGTAHSDELCAKATSAYKEIKKVAVVKSLFDTVKTSEIEKLEAFKAQLSSKGVEVCEIDGEILKSARVAWNILMCAELCNNVSRYDGIKYGYRSQNYTTIGELYTNSRTEAFGELLKTAILYGSETLSDDNYMKMYDKSMRVRRVLSEYFGELFAEYDALLLPAVSGEYTAEDVKNDKYISFKENIYTAPASITGLPAVVAGGVQLVGEAFSEGSLLELVK